MYLLNRLKKAWKFLVVFTLLTVVLAGCDPRAALGAYPYDRGSVWVCEEPSIVLEYAKGNDGALQSRAVLCWDEEEIPIEILFGAAAVTVMPEGETHYNNRLLNGTWDYENGDLVLYIGEDLFFGNKFEKLVFSKKG